jgi:SNF family Na+-dependent transporter
MPILFILSFAVLFRVLSLGTPNPAKPDQNLINGLGYMWNPNLEPLKNPEAWLAAAGQIFFTLSVGFGIIINYASYLRPNDDVALSSLSATSMNEFSEVCHGGLITIPASFIFLGAVAMGQMDSSFHVGFVALPNVFDAMWGGRAFGFMWYFMLFIAAIAASVSMLQPCIAFLEEGFGLKRHASAAMLGMIAAIGCGFVLYFSKNSLALDTLDFWVGTLMIFLLAMFQTWLYGWVLGIERGNEELHRGAQLKVPYFVQYVLKYVTPLYLLAIFVTFCYYKLRDRINAIRREKDAV